MSNQASKCTHCALPLFFTSNTKGPAPPWSGQDVVSHSGGVPNSDVTEEQSTAFKNSTQPWAGVWISRSTDTQEFEFLLNGFLHLFF